MLALARQSTRSARALRGIRAMLPMAFARQRRRHTTTAPVGGGPAGARRSELPVARRRLLRFRRWVHGNPGILVLALGVSEAVLILCVLELVVV
jgi:hypothetical protein